LLQQYLHHPGESIAGIDQIFARVEKAPGDVYLF
jgi:hypothetical protein